MGSRRRDVKLSFYSLPLVKTLLALLITLGPAPALAQSVPFFTGHLTFDFVEGRSFSSNAAATVEVFDSPGGTLRFSASVATDANGTFFSMGVDLQPGMHIKVTDVSTISKALTLEAVTVDSVNPNTNIASGTAHTETQTAESAPWKRPRCHEKNYRLLVVVVRLIVTRPIRLTLV